MRFVQVLPSMLLVCGLSAQGVVSPAHFTNAEAPSTQSVAFGATQTPYRYLQVHNDLQGTARTIKGMSLRRNGTTTTLAAAYSVTLSAWCSDAATTATTVSATFDNNHGANKVQVVNNKAFNFPQTGYGLVPSPFEYNVTFDAPYSFMAAAPLCWEVQITARTNTAGIAHDYASGASTNPVVPSASYGLGCKVAGQANAMGATGTSSQNWPMRAGTLTINGTAGPASAPIFVLLGANNASFSGIPLPFLLPGSPTSPSGVCFLYTDILIVTPGATLANGTSTTNIPVPLTPDLNGLRVFEQIMAVAPTQNPIGLVLSDVVNHNWVAPYTAAPIGRVSLVSSLGAIGTATASQGLVIRFDL